MRWNKEFGFHWVMGSQVKKLSDLNILKDDSAAVENGLKGRMDAPETGQEAGECHCIQECFFGSVMFQIPYFNKYLLSTCYAPDQTLGERCWGFSSKQNGHKSLSLLHSQFVDGQEISEIDSMLDDC